MAGRTSPTEPPPNDTAPHPFVSAGGRRALVAGASSGIGAACAVALGRTGAEVTLCARRAPELQSLAAEMAQAGMQRNIWSLDITDVATTEAALAALPAFDILVNSAGLARHSPAIETTPEDFDAASNLNFRAAYFLTRTVAARLIAEGKPGSLINISSPNGPCRRHRPRGLFRHQTRAGRHDQKHGDRMGPAWHPRQHHSADIHPHAADRADLCQPRTRRMDASKIKLGRVGEVRTSWVPSLSSPRMPPA